MKTTIAGIALASIVMSIGCAGAIARHDLFERGEARVQRAVETARRTCRQQQPKEALPSPSEYEHCVFEELRRRDATVARR